jgi:HEPN domain-containing protein/predicted nucleotidyltransferase
MKTSLSHLPENNQHEILRIVEIIKEETDPEKIILFGSYAKGTHTAHSYFGRDGIRYEYMSDYDLLVVTNEAQEKSYELEDRVTNRSRMYRSSVNMEIHNMGYINEGLEFGQYFFADIVKEGVLLYDKGTVQFSVPRQLTPGEEKEISQRYFDKWFPPGQEFISASDLIAGNGNLKIAAFQLHQATETFYYTTLLVFTGYKPKTHNLSKLRAQTKLLSEELYLIFPAESNKQEKHLFELLKRGYVDARYRDDYVITKEELSTLIERVKEMKDTVERICKAKINSIVQ